MIMARSSRKTVVSARQILVCNAFLQMRLRPGMAFQNYRSSHL